MTISSQSEVRAAFDRCRGNLVMTGVFSFFINLLMLSGPLYMMQVYDRVLTSRSVSTLVALSVLVAVLLLFMGALELIRSRLLVRVGARIDAQLGSRVFDAVVQRRLWRSGQAGTQPLGDLKTLREFLSGQGPLAFFDAPWVPVYLGVIYLLHPLLFLVSAGGALILFAIALMGEILTRKPMAAASHQSFAATAVAEAGQQSAEAVRAMGMLPGLRRRWLDRHARALGHQRAASDRAGTLSAGSKTLRLILQSAILGAGAALAIEQIISAGAMIAASIIMGRALAPVDQAIGNWRGFIGARAAYRRLHALLDQVPAAPTRLALPPAQGHLAVQNLVAGPPEATRAVVSGIAFELAAGSALGVIGPSASGKSTLARLLTGVWQPQIGTVRLDGAALDQWDNQALGRQIGYLPQDVELFAGTVGDNIARLADHPDPEAIVAAARSAGVHDMILRLPDGYNSQIGDGGGHLSGGQRQRLGLARALYGDPTLVVLDEPNANLDAEGDAALTQAIHTIKDRGGIVIVMTHRPSAIEAVDLLLLLDGGRQQAFGPKAEVLAATTQNAAALDGRITQLQQRHAS